VAAQLAQRLDIAYLDTGAMYRALTLAAINSGVSLDDPTAVESLAQKCRMELIKGPSGHVLYVNGREVGPAIRRPEVTENAFKVAQLTRVRALLVEQQRRIAAEMDSLVTEGRDQGTVVFPDAPFKFYLDAAPACRARRRWQELRQKGISVSLEEILSAQQQRDARDTTRQNGPLKIPDNAVVIDTTHLSIEQVVEQLYHYIRERRD